MLRMLFLEIDGVQPWWHFVVLVLGVFVPHPEPSVHPNSIIRLQILVQLGEQLSAQELGLEGVADSELRVAENGVGVCSLDPKLGVVWVSVDVLGVSGAPCAQRHYLRL